MNPIRVYADTSVFGGCFDDEFATASERFLQEVRDGKFTLVLSATTLRELQRAPDRVRDLLSNPDIAAAEIIEETDEIDALRDAYPAEEIVGPSAAMDAEHIAAASVGTSTSS